MPIISYAQNFEDVMLWRALQHVDNGFYIDVGANDPVTDSVSLAFYERGWRGVHVEPTGQFSNKLRSARPDEPVEQVAIGRQEDSIIFYEFEDTGLSTADPEIARQHKNRGFSVTETRVKVLPLRYIFEKYNDRIIHWLKIDVEGLEKEVLESWEDSLARPWVLIIESTKPSTNEESFQDWESIVLSKGYKFSYFDGLNRFYVHDAHQDLVKHFSVPPNVFDGVVLSGLASNSLCDGVLKMSRKLEVRAGEAELRMREAEARACSEEARVQALVNSTSWKVTAPLRKFVTLTKQPSPVKLKYLAKILLRHSALFVRKRPWLRRVVLSLLNRIPRLKYRLVMVSASLPSVSSKKLLHFTGELAHLNPRAHMIYTHLSSEVKIYHKGKQ